MLPTLEVRWFIRSKIPIDVRTWFQQGELKPEEENPRVDYYLRIKDINSLSLKLREGRLEVKQRHTDHGMIRFHERVSGRVEGWYKWSFYLADNERMLNEVSSSSSIWVAVRKERVLRKYAVINQTEVISIPVGQFVDRGCQVELSNITVEYRSWWSLCFEAIGEGAGVHDVLSLVTRSLLVGGELPTLPAEDSCSYPYWLNHCAIP